MRLPDAREFHFDSKKITAENQSVTKPHLTGLPKDWGPNVDLRCDACRAACKYPQNSPYQITYRIQNPIDCGCPTHGRAATPTHCDSIEAERIARAVLHIIKNQLQSKARNRDIPHRFRASQFGILVHDTVLYGLLKAPQYGNSLDS